MLLDRQNTLSDMQLFSLAAVPLTVVSANGLDLWGGTSLLPDTMGNTLLADVGRSRTVFLLVQVTVAPTSGGAATVSFELITATNDLLTTGVVSHQLTAAIPVAQLVAGYQFKLEITPGLPSTGRYLGVRYNVATAQLTGAGAFTASIVADKQTNIAVG